MEKGKKEKPGLTIVGGQPRQRKGRAREAVVVPVGLEKLLFLAASDPALKDRLIENPRDTVKELKINLRPSEQAMLDTVSPSALEAMVARIVPQNLKRRKFMGLVAAAAASLAAGTVAGSCGDDDDNDDSDDTDTVDTDNQDTDLDGGAGPDTDVDSDSDTDEVDTDNPDTDVDGGVGPDSGVDGGE